MFRTTGDRPPLWESRLPPEVLRLPGELTRVDALLDDPAFFAPFYFSDGSFTDYGVIQPPDPTYHRVGTGQQYQFLIDYSHLSAASAGNPAEDFAYAPGTPSPSGSYAGQRPWRPALLEQPGSLSWRVSL